MENEIWNDIKGFEGIYQVSNKGRVRSLDRFVKYVDRESVFKKGEIRKQVLLKNGYYSIILCKNNKCFTKYVHRLVAEAFIPNAENYPQVNHKDENKKNNDKDNLEWCTSLYNNNYGTKNMRMSEKVGKIVMQYTKNGEFVASWKTLRKAQEETGVNFSNIFAVCTGKRKTAGGYVWKYKEGNVVC